MTPAEVIQSAAAMNEVGLTCLSIYLTAISGYLIAAFVAGARLTTSQLVIVNTLYLCFTSLVAYGAVVSFYGARLLQNQYETTVEVGDTGGVAIWIMTGTLILGLAATLKFMADIRRKGTTDAA